jgi:hypothetical protein
MERYLAVLGDAVRRGTFGIRFGYGDCDVERTSLSEARRTGDGGGFDADFTAWHLKHTLLGTWGTAIVEVASHQRRSLPCPLSRRIGRTCFC